MFKGNKNNTVKAYIEEMKRQLENTNMDMKPIENEESDSPVLKENEVGSEAFKVAGLPKTTCSICQENKVRLRKKTPKKSSRQYYENEVGQAWNGLKCPTCFQEKSRVLMREKRAIKS